MLTLPDSLYLRQEAIEPFIVLKVAMYPVCTMHNMDFRSRVEEHELDHCKSLIQAVDVILTDSPYKTCRVKKKTSTLPMICFSEDMKELVSYCKDVIKPDAHKHMFCRALQIRLWYRHIVKKQEDADIVDAPGSNVEN